MTGLPWLSHSRDSLTDVRTRLEDQPPLIQVSELETQLASEHCAATTQQNGRAYQNQNHGQDNAEADVVQI